jgi:hypothetical protein
MSSATHVSSPKSLPFSSYFGCQNTETSFINGDQMQWLIWEKDSDHTFLETPQLCSPSLSFLQQKREVLHSVVHQSWVD